MVERSSSETAHRERVHGRILRHVDARRHQSVARGQCNERVDGESIKLECLRSVHDGAREQLLESSRVSVADSRQCETE